MDDGQKQKLEAMRREAEVVAARAASERSAAEAAATEAKRQQDEAKRVALEAERLAAEAAKAKREAEALRAQAESSAAQNKASAEEAARAAEERERAALAASQRVAAERAATEKLAAEAERKKRDLEEAAAMATLAHKKQLAELAEKRAEAEKEQKAAAEARTQAALAKKEAEAAQKAALAATQAAEETRNSTAAKMREIAEREKQLEASRNELARAQAKLAEEQKQLAAARTEQARRAEEQERQADARLAEAKRIEEKQRAERERLADARRQHLRAEAAADSDNSVPAEALVTPKPRSTQLASLAIPSQEAQKRFSFAGVSSKLEGNTTRVTLKFDGAPRHEVERLDNPPRLVVDLFNTAPKSKRATYTTHGKSVQRVRLGEHGSTLRAVFDLAAGDVSHEVTTDGRGITIAFTSPNVTATSRAAVAEEPPANLDPTERSGSAAEHESAQASVRDVRFSVQKNRARIVVEMNGSSTALVDDRSPKSWVLQLRDTTVTKQLERSLDTSAYGTAVRLVSTYQAQTSPPVVNVVASIMGSATGKLSQEGDTLVWEIEGDGVREPMASSATAATAGFQSQATTLAQTMPKQSQKRVNMRLKDADLVNVIRFIADVTGENIIVSEDVKGKVTVNLRNVPWEQALDMILKTRGYDKVRQNNILRIATAEQIQREKEMELAKRKAQIEVEDTLVRMIPINYAIARDISEQLKPSLSPRGSIQVDDRTNTIIAEDIRDHLDRIIELTKRLDRQTPQVLIEARIVEAASSFQDELGIQWGGTAQASARTGNPTGLAFPFDVISSGAVPDGGFTTGTGSPGRYAVNLPAAIGAGAGGGIGFILGSASGSQILNLRLSALESNGNGRIISSPRVTTLDNRTAKIAQGIDIPISVVSAAGTSTRFIPANLELEVTPHVTNDGSVLLKIKTSKNEPDFTRTGAQGDPTIVKKFAETEVMVKDADTAVIGGIYTRSTSENFSEVPFLSKIPVLGWLFKNRARSDTRAELLVFITPRIINRDESVLVSDASGQGAATSESAGE